ncbi:hypothetical protein [Paracoccus rhizosphaerae]|uniref:Uncharacterized protein n=1 Tax=Paracoccus rhizosphaerae TaxID=1133347 RepID=A0ABV6CJV0_9RHOB|nr:hypothetical protein [Paracoccus rhizosphaerae]
MPCARPFGIFAHRTPLHSPVETARGSDGLTRLDATITDININGSDPTLQVRAPDGMNWTIELASHARNRAIGLTNAAVLPGDRVQVAGEPGRAFGEARIKALRLTINDQLFDLAEESPTAA